MTLPSYCLLYIIRKRLVNVTLHSDMFDSFFVSEDVITLFLNGYLIKFTTIFN